MQPAELEKGMFRTGAFVGLAAGESAAQQKKLSDGVVFGVQPLGTGRLSGREQRRAG